MKLYRVNVTRRTEVDAQGEDEFYVTAASTENALAAVVADLGAQRARRIAGWKIDLVSNKVVVGS